MRDALIFLGCWLLLGVLIVAAIHRAKTRRPYRAARRDDDRGDWADPIPPNDPRLPAGINRLLDDYAALDPDLRHVFGPDAPAPTNHRGNS